MNKIFACALLIAAALPAFADNFDAPNPDKSILQDKVKWGGVMDLRYHFSDRAISYGEGGDGVLRYGSHDTVGDGKPHTSGNGFTVPQVSLVIEGNITPEAKIHVQTNYNTDVSSGGERVGIVEVYGQNDYAVDDWTFRVKGGDFIPDVSYEHPGKAWSTRYTTTPSAMNAWVGEDLRNRGVEAGVKRTFGEHSAHVAVAAISGEDQMGRGIEARGWTLTDLQSTVGDIVASQGNSFSIHRELDGRLGYYGRGDLNFFGDAVSLGGGYWANNANDQMGSRTDLNTQPFRTHFSHFGGKFVFGDLTFISQYMKLTTHHLTGKWRDWRSEFALLSYKLGPVRLSERYDHYDATAWDNSNASTSYIGVDVGKHQRLSAEFIYLYSRPAQNDRPKGLIQRQGLLNYRLEF